MIENPISSELKEADNVITEPVDYTFDPEKSNLVYHAKTELDAIGMTEDSEDEIRNSQISLDEIKKYGYSFLENNSDILKDMFGEDEYEDFDDDDFFEDSIDENEIVSFLNEYYIINPNNLPESELF